MNYVETKSFNRIIAIGDIHGHSNILKTILDSIDPKSDDLFIILGDMVNRGPDAKGVVETIMELENKSTVLHILGNHEEMIIAAHQGGKSELNFWKKFGGVETLASYGVSTAKEIPLDHLKFLISDSKDYVETEDFIFVHSFCHPELPLEQNIGDVLRWFHLPSADEFDIPPHKSGKTVVCGHTAQKQIMDLGHLLCIDTGCGVWVGGRLSAIDLKSGTIWQANGKSKKATVSQRKDLKNGA